VRRRASGAVVVVGTRGAAIMLVGLVSTVVLARLLTPRDFGVVAVGLTFMAFIGLLSDGGLGGALIRRAEPPDASELRALLGLQLTVTAVLTAAIAAVSVTLGEGGRVAALMVCAMPVVAFQFPGKITLERELRFRPLAWVEVAQVLSYHGTAVVLVVAGAGVWGIAIGALVRALVGAVGTNLVSPVRILRPTLSWGKARPLMAFGARMQLINGTLLARDQGLNMAIAAVAGVGTLGLYALARRLLEVPYLILSSLWRVSFPAMSQLLAAKQDPGRLVERAFSVALVGTGVVLVGLTGSAPGLVPGVFGAHWSDASQILPGACLGMLVAGSVSIATHGFLYAVGDASAVLRATLASAIAMFASSLPLLPALGAWALGLGLFLSAMVEASLLARSARRRTQVRFGRILAVPAVLAVVSAAAGWSVAVEAGRNLLSGSAGGVVSVGCYLLGLRVLRRAQLAVFLETAGRAVANARRREGPAT
jgi:O-antigen/teichoic acid export membrane protein